MPQPHAQLFDKLLKGELSPDEADVLVSLLGTDTLSPSMEELVIAHLQQKVAAEDIDPKLQDALEQKLPAILGSRKVYTLSIKPWLRYAAALVILIGLGLSVFLLQERSSQKQAPLAQSAPVLTKQDIKPGKQGAVLTLADGKIIVLDSLKDGLVATQSGSAISLTNGQLAYDKKNSEVTKAEYNTIETPRGRQFQLTLVDGTKVWLNAASSLRFPTVFSGKERRVEITGEAYFEVAKNPSLPFKVSISDGTEVEVLGTHFNINAYPNESATNTTLLEGAVKVSNATNTTVIKPAQQVRVSRANTGNDTEKFEVLSNVNVSKIVAWKDGSFDFDNATLGEVMRQLERWYDIDVVYEKNIPRLEFFGKMGRDLSLSNVLRGLEISKVHFRLEQKKLIVLP